MQTTTPGERQPLCLLPMMAEHQKQNMREHLAAVNEIIAALAKKHGPHFFHVAVTVVDGRYASV